MMMITAIIIHFFVNLRAELNNQWPVTVSTNINSSSNRTNTRTKQIIIVIQFLFICVPAQQAKANYKVCTNERKETNIHKIENKAKS
jgi:hypothetical protein